MMDSAGASTFCTKVVAPSLCTQSGTSAGRAMQLTSTGMKGSMSRLPTMPQISFMALVPAVCRRKASREHTLPYPVMEQLSVMQHIHTSVKQLDGGPAVPDLTRKGLQSCDKKPEVD